MSIAAWFGLAAGVLHLAAYAIYGAQSFRREIRPNGMTWLMWAYGASAFLLIEVLAGAPASVLALPAVCAASAIAIAAGAFLRAAYVPPRPADRIALAADSALVGGFLAATRLVGTARAAPVFVALAGLSALTSSWPVLCATYRAPANERPLAWFVWSAAYGCLGLATMAEGLHWAYLAYPALLQAVSMAIGVFALEGRESVGAPGSAA